MVGAIYHRLITTTRKKADVDEDQYCGQLPTNILIQLIINLVFSVIQRYWKSKKVIYLRDMFIQQLW